MSTPSLQLDLPGRFRGGTAPRDARPFMKWVGGKQQLLNQFESLFPTSFRSYFEPFVGGGAVYFHLWNERRIKSRAFLFDNNEELVNAYVVTRDKIDALIEALTVHKNKHSKKHYYNVRHLDREATSLSDVERAARTIYLNKTCYNGLYRVNSKGQFNVPMGSYTNPRVLNEIVLRTASRSLQGTSIELKDFRGVVSLAKLHDFFYFDPPYDPLSKTANFTSYTPDNFSEGDQRELSQAVSLLADKGAYFMLSNSNTPLVRELYRDFRIKTVRAKRAVNSDANGRGFIEEIVVTNY